MRQLRATGSLQEKVPDRAGVDRNVEAEGCKEAEGTACAPWGRCRYDMPPSAASERARSGHALTVNLLPPCEVPPWDRSRRSKLDASCKCHRWDRGWSLEANLYLKSAMCECYANSKRRNVASRRPRHPTHLSCITACMNSGAQHLQRSGVPTTTPTSRKPRQPAVTSWLRCDLQQGNFDGNHKTRQTLNPTRFPHWGGQLAGKPIKHDQLSISCAVGVGRWPLPTEIGTRVSYHDSKFTPLERRHTNRTERSSFEHRLVSPACEHSHLHSWCVDCEHSATFRSDYNADKALAFPRRCPISPLSQVCTKGQYCRRWATRQRRDGGWALRAPNCAGWHGSRARQSPSVTCV